MDKDDGLREITIERVSRLPTPFKKNGTITAAGAS